MFSLDFRVHSEVGRVRKNNQDAAFASPNLLVVADGMGAPQLPHQPSQA